MKVKYLDEYIENQDGINCHVIDINSLDFDCACLGRKITEIIVVKANGGECIETINSDGKVESSYMTKLGDAIFYNSEIDKYVPRGKDGTAWKYDEIEKYDYEIVSEEFLFNSNKAVKVKRKSMARILPEVILEPSVIKDVFGSSMHQFLFPGATLKQDIKTGRITGIGKEEFKSSWEIVGLE